MYFGTIWTLCAPKKIHSKKFWDTSILSKMHWTSNIFGHSVATIGVFWASLNYSILNLKKIVCPKNVWMRHWYARFIFNNYRPFVNSLLELVRSYVMMVLTYVKVATVTLRKTKSLVMQFFKKNKVSCHQLETVLLLERFCSRIIQ